MHDSAHLWRTGRRGSSLLHRRCGCLRCLYNTHLHPSLLRWGQVQSRAMEPRRIQHANRCRCVCFCCSHGSDSDAAQLDWIQSWVSLPLRLPSLKLIFFSPTVMNWTCLVYGGPMLFVNVWWVVSARKWFKGPKVSIFSAFVLSAIADLSSTGQHRAPDAGQRQCHYWRGTFEWWFECRQCH